MASDMAVLEFGVAEVWQETTTPTDRSPASAAPP
jgi:hypothetical protein